MFNESDLIAGDFLFMRRYMSASLQGKIIVRNTSAKDNIALLKERGVKTVITTIPHYDGLTFGTNMTEAMLTAYTGKGRRLSDDELNELVDDLGVRLEVMRMQWFFIKIILRIPEFSKLNLEPVSKIPYLKAFFTTEESHIFEVGTKRAELLR